MSESSGGHRNGLDEFEAARLIVSLEIMYGAISDGIDEDETDLQRLIARDQIVDLLTDPKLAEATARHLIDDYFDTTKDKPAYSIYVYWSILKRANEVAPGMPLPSSLMNFTENLAEEKDEMDIVFSLIEIKASFPDESDQDSNDEELPEPDQKPEELTLIETIAAETKEKVFIKHLASQAVLGNLDSPAHMADRQRLMHRDRRPTDLLEDIQNNRFVTWEGMAAAKAQQDSDRLAIRDRRPTDLLEDIQNNRFVTAEGLLAAKAQQDRDRIAIRSGRPSSLLEDIRYSRFTTVEGLAAAKAQQDNERLAIRAGRPTNLLDDIQNNRFTTAEGLAAAKNQQDNDRLVMRYGSPASLLEDIQHNRFLTAQGMAAAKAQQDSDRLRIYADRPSALREALRYNWFLTVDGIAAAKRLLGIE